MPMVLYAALMSSATPVLNALAELDVPYELVQVDLSAGDQRKPDFLALNPNGKVPTLVVDGTPMFEALAIMQWLGDRFGVERGLWPAADDPARLEALSWSTWTYVTFSAAMTRLSYATGERVSKEMRHEAQVAHTHEELQELLGLLDARLATRRFVLGGEFSLVDLIVGSGVTYGAYCGIPTQSHAHVEAWLARFHARPAYQKTWARAVG